jgi:Rod binding domain-containing protein
MSSGVIPNGLPIGSTQSALPSPQEAAKQFEGYFLKLLLGEMSRTVPSGGLFSGVGNGTYQALLQDALASRAAEAGSFGLAKQLLDSWRVKP